MEQSNGMPSAELRDLLRKTFGVKKPKKLDSPIPLPVHDEVKKDQGRSVGNPSLSAEAQKIYSGGGLMPPVPMKPPTNPQVNRGTVGGMDTTGAWGQAQEGK